MAEAGASPAVVGSGPGPVFAYLGLLGVMGMAGAAWTIRCLSALNAYRIESNSWRFAAFGVALVVSLGAIAVYGALVRRTRAWLEKKERTFMAFGIAWGLFSLAFFFALIESFHYVNITKDAAPVPVVEARVEHKFSNRWRKDRGPEVRFELADGRTLTLEVDPDEYKRMEPGDRLALTLHPGRLGVAWVRGEDLARR